MVGEAEKPVSTLRFALVRSLPRTSFLSIRRESGPRSKLRRPVGRRDYNAVPGVFTLRATGV